jgi:truncated hemoglobin YjbI
MILSLGLPVDHRDNLRGALIFRFMSTSWEGTRDYKGTHCHPTYAMEHDISQIGAFTTLLDAGADLQRSNEEGETLLHVTAKRW